MGNNLKLIIKFHNINNLNDLEDITFKWPTRTVNPLYIVLIL